MFVLFTFNKFVKNIVYILYLLQQIVKFEHKSDYFTIGLM